MKFFGAALYLVDVPDGDKVLRAFLSVLRVQARPILVDVQVRDRDCHDLAEGGHPGSLEASQDVLQLWHRTQVECGLLVHEDQLDESTGVGVEFGLGQGVKAEDEDLLAGLQFGRQRLAEMTKTNQETKAEVLDLEMVRFVTLWTGQEVGGHQRETLG